MDEDKRYHVASDKNVADICSRGIDYNKADPASIYVKFFEMLHEACADIENVGNNVVNVEKAFVRACNVEIDSDTHESFERAYYNICNAPRVIDDNNLSHCEKATKANDSNSSRAVDHNVNAPEYIAHIAENNLKYSTSVKMIACQNRYVVHKLHEKSVKTNAVLEIGFVKSHELKKIHS